MSRLCETQVIMNIWIVAGNQLFCHNGGMSEPVVNESKKKYSDRDKLKMLGAGLIALGGAVIAPKISESEVNVDGDGIVSVDTRDGSYYPMLELHNRKLGVEQLNKLPRLDAFMYEFVEKQSVLFEKNLTDLKAFDSSSGGDRPLLSPLESDFFGGKGICIAVEGQMPKENVAVGILLADALEFFASSGYLFKRLYDVKQNRDKGLKDVTFDSIDASIVGWGSAPFWSTMLSMGFQMGKNENKVARDVPERIADRISAIAGHMHPETLGVFFRNVNFARQQILLNKYFREQPSFSSDLPKLGYRIGGGHGDAVADMIRMGEDFIYPILERYPRNFWKNMVELNGGVTTTASTPLFEPRFGGASWDRIAIRDSRYEQILRERTGDWKS